MKRCLICDEIKPLSEYHIAKDKPDGHRNDCKNCRKYGRKVDVNAPKIRCYNCNELKDKNKDNFHVSNKSKFGVRRLCKECHKINNRKNHLCRNYNLSVGDYDKMVDKQDGKCMICNNTRKLFVDHSHSTGEVRGLLCDTCNRGIGFLQESKDILLNSIKYLDPTINDDIWLTIIKLLIKDGVII
jgi:hypothetical protein